MRTLLLATAASLSVPAQPAPPLVANARAMLAWMPGEVRCAGAVVLATPMRRPWTSLGWAGTTSKPLTYRFAVTASGRTTGISRQGGKEYMPFSDDVAPSLAATRFAVGAAHESCVITYVPRLTSLAETPVADLISYTITPLSGALPEEGWARIRTAGNCTDAPRPEPLLTALPNFRALPGTPGVKDWSLVGYDLDIRGRPARVHVVAGTTNTSLDQASVEAMKASRFTAGTARHGCRYPYWRTPTTLAPPLIPEEKAVRPAGATCPSQHDWSLYPTLRFPEAYQRRAIEGWAIVVYDVAPWGEVGNAHVIASEPTEDFGTQALTLIRSAKVPTTQGLIGCVDRVRFKMPETGTAQAAVSAS